MRKLDLLKQQRDFLLQHHAPKEELDKIELKIEQSKRGRRNKNKGRNYEHIVKDKVNKKYPKLELVRTPSSGGFQKASTNDELRGDVSNVNRDYTFLLHLECKDHKTWKLKDWIKQATDDCPKGKIPTVVFHQQQEIENGKVVQKAEDYICLKLSDFLGIVDEKKIIKKN
jgi:hypothetical protein